MKTDKVFRFRQYQSCGTGVNGALVNTVTVGKRDFDSDNRSRHYGTIRNARESLFNYSDDFLWITKVLFAGLQLFGRLNSAG